MECLDAARIGLPGIDVRVLARCTSTNSLALEWTGPLPVLLAAESQTAGRGRRGRRWHSAPGADVAFSLALLIRRPVRELGVLSLVAGVAAAEALRAMGVAQAALKWPNDLMMNGAKLGGILVETRREGAAGTRTVFGIGINCRRDRQLAARLGRPIAALDEVLPPSRNLVIREVTRSLVMALDRFERDGFEALRPRWEVMDAHAGQRLRLRLAGGRSLSGVASGLAADGGLRISNRRGEHVVTSGRIVCASGA